MITPQQLIQRLDDIGQSLAQTSHALALIGLGSAAETERMDAYSDLDFFVIVEPGHKQTFLQNLSWLTAVSPLAYCFQNTADGHKLLFEDGIFCETAVFEPAELSHIPFAEGRIVWKADGIDDAIRTPIKPPTPHTPHPVEWLVGEALTNLYVGLGRYQRGEKLSAYFFVQQYAVGRILDLSPYVAAETAVSKDPFTPDRRYEQRFPTLAHHLPNFIQGYAHTPQSALAILAFLDQHFDVNPALKAKIVELATLKEVIK